MEVKKLWGKRKYYSAWGVWLICIVLFFGINSLLLIFNKIGGAEYLDLIGIFKDLTIFIWLGYFGANTISKFAKNKLTK